MNRNSLLVAVLSLATIFLLSTPVESCVNFKAAEVGSDSQLYNIELWDNGQKVCSCNCYSNNQIYTLSCISSAIQAIFDLSDTHVTGHVTYTTGHATFGFDTYGDPVAGFKACLYDCGPNDCNL